MLRLSAFILFLIAAIPATAGVYVYTGVYQGKDLYVKNPFSSEGVGFCVFEVTVNGEVTSDEINSSAFAIDLTLFNLEPGDPVEVVIRSKDNCEPRVINPEDIAPKSTFTVASLALADAGSIVFRTQGEGGPLPFVVEQFKWNKWVQVATVDGKGDMGVPNEYRVEVPLHSGANTFRLRQNDASGPRYSERFEVSSDQKPVALRDTRFYDKLAFSAPTSYEVFDAYGILYAKGAGKEIDTNEWPRGDYYVNFDDDFGVAVRKR